LVFGVGIECFTVPKWGWSCGWSLTVPKEDVIGGVYRTENNMV